MLYFGCVSYAVGNAGYRSADLYPKLRPAIPLLVCVNYAVGNAGYHNADQYPKLRPAIPLLVCVSYAVGNAGYHSADLYPRLRPAIPLLVELLRDPVTKTRCHAANACGNLSLHSPALCQDLIKAKAVNRLLDLVCHDTQYNVQSCALLALRTMSQQPSLKKEMLVLKAAKKLSPITSGHTPRGRSGSGSRPISVVSSLKSSAGSLNTVVNHCNKLLLVLKG
ncbi:serine/threonine-protein kinase 36-like [Liolophura sinensis]|uniref:serine/threonine-protein kinase 36-like n=1 Tax=Liolophura sinensis TaxID=3198878 RepID=UPI0031581289